jgi:hypothetical protein
LDLNGGELSAMIGFFGGFWLAYDDSLDAVCGEDD